MAELPRKNIPPVSVSVAASKLFTYPTRLANCWSPTIQEINLPQYVLTRPEIEIALQQGSTRSLGIRSAVSPLKNATKGLLKNLSPPIQAGNEYIYDSRYEIDGNIAHVLDNVASAVLAVQKVLPNVTVVLRAKASGMARKAFELLKIPIICTDANVVGRLVYLKEAGRNWFTGDTGMYSFLFQDKSFDGYKPVTPQRIFISRRGTRCLLNELEVEETLRAHGFEKVYFEDIPLSDQWSLARNAEAIVAIHGAGLFNLVFNQNSVKLVELFHPGYFVHGYRHLVNAIGGTWCGVTGQLPPEIVQHLDYKQSARHFALHPTRIDTNSLKKALSTVGIS